jgi:hypothetical protein
MLSARLVHLIETHADQLSHDVLLRLQHDPRCADLVKVPAEELRSRSYEVYRNLSDWLLGSKTHEIERLYTHLGERRAGQGVAMASLLYAITLTKDQLWHFLEAEGLFTQPVELFGEMELFRMLDQFFDRALYHAALGHEQAQHKVAA